MLLGLSEVTKKGRPGKTTHQAWNNYCEFRERKYLSIYLDKDIPWVTEFACVYYISCSLDKDRAVCYCRLAKCNGRRSTPATQLVTALFHKSYKSSVSVTQQIPIKETNKQSKTKQKKHTHTQKKSKTPERNTLINNFLNRSRDSGTEDIKATIWSTGKSFEISHTFIIVEIKEH